jgi:acyl-CoA hydrolase
MADLPFATEPPMSAALPEARLLEMVFPDHTNHLGTLFGGQALAWMDKAAFIVASRHARRIVVTARSEEVNFRVPVRKGQLVELVARITDTGRSSMQVEVEMTAEDPLSGDRRVCTTGRFVMIALDSNGSPTAVPALA